MHDCSRFNSIQRLREFSNCLRSMIFKSIINGMKLPLYYGILTNCNNLLFQLLNNSFWPREGEREKDRVCKKVKIANVSKNRATSKYKHHGKGWLGAPRQSDKLRALPHPPYPPHPNIPPTRIYVWTTKPNVITYRHPKKHPIYSQGKGV